MSRDARIPVWSVHGSTAGHLIPVTEERAQDPAIIDALFRWRKAHMAAFLTVFTPTPDKTRDYLTAFSLPDPGRILFLLADRAGRHVGHIGLCNITAADAEIDNVIRGEAVDTPDFMVRAHEALLRFAFVELGIASAYLNVLADNTRAIRTYRKVGFRAAGTTPLTREERDDGYRLRPAEKPQPNVRLPMLVRMEMARAAFLANATPDLGRRICAGADPAHGNFGRHGTR
jgi:RimJ/RimL family protein N-acetyltransferase